MIVASAPGSLVLLGEHAVLDGHPALVMAHAKRLSVTLTLGGKGRWVQSDRYGDVNLDSANIPPHFAFVHHICQLSPLLGPFTLQIFSEFEGTWGLGSSGALIVATLGAFWKAQNSSEWLQEEIRHSLLKHGKQILQQVQGLGSGADLAASLWGGVQFYDPQQNVCRSLPKNIPLVAVYSGKKRKTQEVVPYVRERIRPFPSVCTTLFQTSRQLVLAGEKALQARDYDQFGVLCNISQGLMESLGVNTPVLQDLIDQLRSSSGIKGAKISGAGMGDCVMGVGALTSSEMQSFAPYPVFPIETATEGLVFDTP